MNEIDMEQKAQEFVKQQTETTQNQQIEKINDILEKIIKQLQTNKGDILLISQHLKAYSDKYKELFKSIEKDQSNFQKCSDDVVKNIIDKINSQSDIGYSNLIKQLLESDEKAKKEDIEKNPPKPQEKKKSIFNTNLLFNSICLVNLILIFILFLKG